MSHSPAALPARSAQDLLLEFVHSGRQEPFEEIVRRYAGMVFNVCLQILGNTHDAEDATQAVFLTLAVQAKTANGVKYLGPWLQRVAQRLSLDVKRSKNRRKAREQRHSDMTFQRTNGQDHDAARSMDLDEMKVVLRDELDKLPSKYRLPLILHYFGGLKPDEMARELGCKPSTLGVRLHRGRKMLADSLTERGIVVSGAMLAVLIAVSVQAAVAETLIHATSRAAVAVAGGSSIAAAAGVSARVAGFSELASTGIVVSRLKTAIAAGVLLASAAAGATEIVRQIAPGQIHFELTPLRSLIEPLFRSMLRPVQATLNWGASLTASSSPSTDELVDVRRISLESGNAPDAFGSELMLQRRMNLGSSSLLVDAATSAQPAAAGNSATRATPVNAAAQNQQIADTASNSGATSSGSGAASGVPASAASSIIAASRFAAASSDSAGAGGLGFASQASQLPAPAISPPSPPVGGASDPSAALASTASITQPTTGGASIIGGPASIAQSVTMDRPITYAPASLTIGDHGRGSFRQTAGQVRTDALALGASVEGNGVYQLGGAGKLNATQVTIGGAGSGRFVQDGSSVAVAKHIELGKSSTGVGEYELGGGQLFADSMFIGDHGVGHFSQTGGVASVTNVHVAQFSGSKGTVDLSNGTFAAADQVVGHGGDGRFEQVGGVNTTANLNLSASGDSIGLYALAAGTLELKSHPTETGVQPARIIVGNKNDGMFRFGAAARTGAIIEAQGSAAPASITVRARPSASGVFQGWGDVRLSGKLDQNGVVIADGFGSDHTLDFSTVAAVGNSIPNANSSTNGWYAHRGGKLVLPAVKVPPGTHTVTWGEDAGDLTPDLVNSLRLTFTDITGGDVHDAHIALLATNRGDVPAAPAGVALGGVWETNFSDFDTASIGFVARYDPAWARNFSPDESGLQLFAYRDGWNAVTTSFQQSTADHLLGAEVPPAALYAYGIDTIAPRPVGVQTPEPGGLVLLALAACGFAGARRRNRRSR